jgi:hypothetical protein
MSCTGTHWIAAETGSDGRLFRWRKSCIEKQPVGFGEHRMMLRPRDGHDQQFPPGLGALSHPVDEADELPPAWPLLTGA